MTKNILAKITVLSVLLSIIAPVLMVPKKIQAQAVETREITFPVIGAVTYYDDFGASRDGGARSHEGNDLMGRKMMPLVAAVDGRISVNYPEPTWGFAVTIRDEDDYTYHYLHMNNDNPGTDDGRGGGSFAYAPDVNNGSRVVAGQLVGWMGDSGNAEGTSAHLHFEIRRPNRTPISPYNSLRAAVKIATPIPRAQQDDELLPYGAFEGGAFVAMGNADRDSQAEVVTGAGPGGGPHVRLMDQDGDILTEFFPYDLSFSGGVDVAMGDVDGDGEDDVITAPSSLGGPHIKMFNADGEVLGSFMAYDPSFTGGVNVTAADIDDDDEAEIITAPARGAAARIRAFNMDGTEVLSFYAYDQNITHGVDVAAYTSGRNVYIATAASTGGAPMVKVFDEEGELQDEFLAYDAGHLGGVRLTMAQTGRSSSTLRIHTVPLLGGSQAKTFSVSGRDYGTAWGFEEWWNGSWDIAAYEDETFMSSNINTRRRASVRELNFSRQRSSNDSDRRRGSDND